jgi:superfamily I DNA/RNA helicase
MNFTKSQQDAIEHGDANLQLIACAGSGETEVITLRVARLSRIRGGLGMATDKDKVKI